MRNRVADELRELIKDFRATYKNLMSALSQQADRLKDASRQISRSWSGSFAGWHGRMYFRDFQIPSIYERFSGEWGGINGIPDGWEEKQPEEVQDKIETLMGKGFSLDKFEEDARSLEKARHKFRDDAATILDQLDVKTLTNRENELVAQIEQAQRGSSKKEYINANLPKTMMSRDTEALRQGICIASWLYYEGVAVDAKHGCEATGKLLEDSERLAKMLDKETPTQTPSTAFRLSSNLHPEIYKKCRELYEQKAYAEAVEKGFKVVRDRLRTLTSHETGSEAFGKGKLHIRGAAAVNVDDDFNHGVKFLTMAIDRFRNEKSHTSDAKIDDPVRAYEYLRLSSLAMHLLDNAEILP